MTLRSPSLLRAALRQSWRPRSRTTILLRKRHDKGHIVFHDEDGETLPTEAYGSDPPASVISWAARPPTGSSSMRKRGFMHRARATPTSFRSPRGSLEIGSSALCFQAEQLQIVQGGLPYPVSPPLRAEGRENPQESMPERLLTWQPTMTFSRTERLPKSSSS